MSSILIAYGGFLACLGVFLRQVAHEQGKVAFMAGLAGGGLCLLWGVAAVAGLQRRVWAILTAIGTIIVFLKQTVDVWTTSLSDEGVSLTMRLAVTLMFLMTMGIIVYLFHGERPPEFFEPGANRNASTTRISRNGGSH